MSIMRWHSSNIRDGLVVGWWKARQDPKHGRTCRMCLGNALRSAERTRTRGTPSRPLRALAAGGRGPLRGRVLGERRAEAASPCPECLAVGVVRRQRQAGGLTRFRVSGPAARVWRSPAWDLPSPRVLRSSQASHAGRYPCGGGVLGRAGVFERARGRGTTTPASAASWSGVVATTGPSGPTCPGPRVCPGSGVPARAGPGHLRAFAGPGRLGGEHRDTGAARRQRMAVAGTVDGCASGCSRPLRRPVSPLLRRRGRRRRR